MSNFRHWNHVLRNIVKNYTMKVLFENMKATNIFYSVNFRNNQFKMWHVRNQK